MLSLAAAQAFADPWIAPGDARLRHDLELLADAGIVRAPLTAWPVSWAEVARDVGGKTPEAGQPAWLAAALARVQSAAGVASRTGHLSGELRIAGSEQPMALRRFGYTPREEGELSAGVQYTGERFAFRAQATAVADADDGKTYRPDGSYAAMVLGNWMLHAGYIDRWWGPGWEGSLILGSNARPIPSVTIERNYSDAIDHPWLHWIGQCRVAATMGQLEGSRDDAPDARFFGARVTWKPHRARRGRHLAQRPVVRRGPALRRRHVLGPAHRQRQRPAARRAARQPDGGLRRALVAALRADRRLRPDDRRGRGGLPAEPVPRPVRRRVHGRIRRPLLAGARRVRRYRLQLLRQRPELRLRLPERDLFGRLPVLRPFDRPFARRRQRAGRRRPDARQSRRIELGTGGPVRRRQPREREPRALGRAGCG